MKAMIFSGDPVSAEQVVAALKLRWPDVEALLASRDTEDLGDVVQYEPDLVVIRGDLPTLDIWSATRGVRVVSDVPIDVVSESNDPMDTVRALDLGADDYMSMPRHPMVLVARVVAVLRRVGVAGIEPETSIVRCGELVMHRRDQAVFLGSERLLLTKTEFNLLSLLVESPLVTLSCSPARRAVIRLPERKVASTTTTPSDKPEMIRLRRGKWRPRGSSSSGCSEITAPASAICW